MLPNELFSQSRCRTDDGLPQLQLMEGKIPLGVPVTADRLLGGIRFSEGRRLAIVILDGWEHDIVGFYLFDKCGKTLDSLHLFLVTQENPRNLDWEPESQTIFIHNGQRICVTIVERPFRDIWSPLALQYERSGAPWRPRWLRLGRL